MLDVRRLRVLHEVARHGSFAAAAAELQYTPSAVSQQIAALEREAGTVLVQRGARGARLTQAGTVLDRHAAAVLGQLAAARAELDDLAALRSGTLRLTAFGSAWLSLVPVAAAAFGRDHPDVDLVLREADPHEAAAAVRAGEADLAVVFEPHGLDDAALQGLERVALCEDPLRAVVPSGHRLARAAAIDLADLAQEPWVTPTGSCAALVRRSCAAAGFEPRVVFSSGDYGAVQGFVAAEAGVALVPALALTAGERLVARPLAARPAPARTIAALTGPEGARAPAVGPMLDALAAAAARVLGQ